MTGTTHNLARTAIQCMLIALSAVSARAQDHALTAFDVEKYADSVFARYLKNYPEPSLALVVVSGDSVLLRKGYGFESIEKHRKVDPDSTVFSVASLSKLVTATAVMQLVESGKLTLDEDIRSKAPNLQIGDPATPVTLRQLLTHTSGLEGPFLPAVVATSSELPSLDEYFGTHPLRRGRPPGIELRYSNIGMALAGYLVERASGERFASYADTHIFKPLGMMSSSFEQPPPDRLRNRTATAGSGTVPDFLALAPAGAMVSTPGDMGRFMIMHLNSSDKFIQMMHTRQWSADPRIPGVGFGFFTSDIGGEPALFHTGARVHFSLMYLLPARRVGIFIVQSLHQGGEFQALRTDFVRGFVHRYFPHDSPLPRTDTTVSARRASRYAGVYRPSLMGTTTIERAAELGADTRVSSLSNGNITLKIPAGPLLELTELDDGLYRVISGAHEGITVAFRKSKEGISGFAMAGNTQDPLSFTRLEWHQRGLVRLGMLAGAMLVVLSLGVSSLVRGVVRLLHRRQPQSASTAERWTWRVGVAAGVLVLLAPLSAVAVLAGFGSEDGAANVLRTAIVIALTLLLIASLLGAAIPLLAVLAWKNRYWTLGRRVHFTLAAVSILVALPLLYHYRLIGYWL